MKAPKINRRFVLCAVLALAIIGMFLVPAASVSAAPPETQDWPLRLVGATNVNVTKAQFETMAAANPSENWTDSTGNVFKGVAMWRLVALVDDGDPATFNDALASVYSIKFTGLNNDGTYYVNTYAPPFTAIPFPHAESVFVANKVMLSGTTSWVDLPLFQPGSTSKLWYPCAIRGAGTTGGGTRTSALVQIELLNLTVTAVGVSPASQSVANGATFTADLGIDTDTASRGWQTNVNFDATKMQCTGVTEGGFLKDWATAHGGSTIAAPGLAIDNVNGHVTSLGYAILGGDAGGPSGAGTLCTLSFMASTSVNDFAGITPSGVVVSDASAVEIPGVVVTGGSVLIGTEPKPDLVVTQKHEDWAVAGSTYTINYTVKNQGNAAAGASTTSIVIDGGAPITVACPALAAGATDTQTTGVQSFSAPTDTIVVTADSAGVVTESNETNNARQNMLSYYGALAGVAVEVTGESYTAHASVVNELVNPAVSYDPLTFMVKVTNTGLLDDKYELTVTDEQGWTLKLDPSELFVMAANPDDAGYAALSVSVPQDTAGGLSDQITVTATGKMATNGGVVIGPVGQATITVTTQALNSVQIELLPGTNEPQTGAPDSPISWLVVVKNTGNVADTFDVAVAESVTGVSSKSAARTSWGASFSAEPGVLPAFTKWASYLKVTVPADAKTSEWNQLTVTITGIGGSSDTYVVKAHVLEPGPQIPEGVVEVTVEDEIVSISCLGVDSYPFGVMGEGESKATAEDFFVIRNTGNVGIDISVRGQDALSMPGEPSAKWVLTNSPNLDEYRLQLNPETAAFGGADTDLTTGDQWIWDAVPESQEVFYGLTLSTPTAVTTPARMWMRITISAIAS